MLEGMAHPEEVEREPAAPETEASRHIEMTVAGLTSIHLIHTEQIWKAISLEAVVVRSITEGHTM